MRNNATVLHNLNLIDMTAKGAHVKKSKAVVLENEKIKSILNVTDIHNLTSRGYKSMDLGGKYLVPGLIDLHVHSTNPFIDPHDALKLSNLIAVQKQVVKNMYNCIRGGVTTVRDMGSPPAIVRFMKMIEKDKITGPRIVPSYSMISCQGGYPDMVPSFNRFLRMLLGGQFAERVIDEEHAVKIVHTLADKGAKWIKTVHQEESYMFGHSQLSILSDDCYATIASTARERKKKIALHALSIAGFRKGIELHVDTLEHLPIEELSAEDIQKIVSKKIIVIPTLIAPGFYLANMIQILKNIINTDNNHLVPKAHKHTTTIIEQIIAGKECDTLIDYNYLRRTFSIMSNNLHRLYEAGASIGFGTDAGGTDICLFGLPYLEMQLMSDAGIPNYEILEIATRKNAAVLDLEKNLGSIEPGKLADLVLVEDNPIENLQNAGRVSKVWRSGEVVYDKQLTW